MNNTPLGRDIKLRKSFVTSQARFPSGGTRMLLIGIVALARRLMIALGRCLEHGMLPQGARPTVHVRG